MRGVMGRRFAFLTKNSGWSFYNDISIIESQRKGVDRHEEKEKGGEGTADGTDIGSVQT